MFRSVCAVLCACWLLTACDDSPSTEPHDAAPADAGDLIDADTVHDAGGKAGADGGPEADGGPGTDGGPEPDGGPEVDGGPEPDGGPVLDGGSDLDGGPQLDGGPDADGGPEVDAGRDAGTSADASVDGAADGGAGEDAGLDAGIEVGPIVRLEIEPAEIFLTAVGDELQLIAKGYDEHGNEVALGPYEVYWRFANERVASMDEDEDENQDGRVLATAVGSTLITAYYQDVGSTALVVVADVLSDAPGFALEDISAGNDHACGTDTNGRAYCWGEGNSGRLGNGSTAWSHWPSAVQSDLVLHGITAGYAHSCALDASGAAYCWGGNYSGALGVGDPDLERALAPAMVAGDLSFTQIRAGGGYTSALDPGGNIFHFGYLAAAAGEDAYSPLALESDLAFREVLAGCALTVEGAAYCWDDGDEDGTMAIVPMADGHLFAQIDMGGGGHFCGVTVDGETWCWGNNDAGQLGDGTQGDGTGEFSVTPVRVNTPETFEEVRVGQMHSCGRTAAGEVWCWGLNESGQLGDGSITKANSPVKVMGGLAFTQITLGSDFSCGLAAGRAYCWGDNRAGRLGAGVVYAKLIHISVVPWPVASPRDH
jgi:alpha-tubulin suppressor-like RCC1 family protein